MYFPRGLEASVKEPTDRYKYPHRLSVSIMDQSGEYETYLVLNKTVLASSVTVSMHTGQDL